jgi:uncharacterized protein YlxW (UPF0749 family)
MLESGIKYVSFKDIEKLVGQTEAIQSENLQLKNQVDLLQEHILTLESSINEGDGIETILQEEIDYYRGVSGIDALAGPGVVIIVSDSERQLLENEDPNNLLVHDLDIQTLIDDLKRAGAEAIAINGQRVLLHMTDVVCNGPTIRINDAFYSQPFIIEAIGDRKYLEASINSPDNYGHVLKQWGIFLEVNTSVYVEIPGYKAPIDFQYMKIKEN